MVQFYTSCFVFCRYRFRPKVLRDVSKVSTKVQLQGEWVESPVGVAPTAMQRMSHFEGESATAKGKRISNIMQ